MWEPFRSKNSEARGGKAAQAPSNRGQGTVLDMSLNSTGLGFKSARARDQEKIVISF